MENQVGLFFYVNGNFIFHGCPLAEAEPYGDFLTFSQSHMEVWEREYEKKYHVDFDYYPRGRITYHVPSGTSHVYYDRCIGGQIGRIVEAYTDGNAITEYDEHYQCHLCNDYYVL